MSAAVAWLKDVACCVVMMPSDSTAMTEIAGVEAASIGRSLDPFVKGSAVLPRPSCPSAGFDDVLSLHVRSSLITGFGLDAVWAGAFASR